MLLNCGIGIFDKKLRDNYVLNIFTCKENRLKIKEVFGMRQNYYLKL